MNINHRKRAAFERRVRQSLTEILNDPEVMPNADCDGLIVSIRQLVFGRTVADVCIDIFGHWRNPDAARSAALDAQRTIPYVDLTDVMHFPMYFDGVALELQRRLDLQFQPRLRPL